MNLQWKRFVKQVALKPGVEQWGSHGWEE